jgi:hypothetical protein
VVKDISSIQTDGLLIFPISSRPLGLSYRDWCNRWCEWIVPIPKNINPTADKSGMLTLQSQIFSDVMFLCQTFESTPSNSHRFVTIPNGSSIFMPIINWISVIGGKEKCKNDLKKKAKEMMDEVVKLQLLINGKLVSLNFLDFRVQTSVLEVVLPKNNIFDIKPGHTLIAADGYWIFFRSHAKQLKIETYGACRSGRTQISVDYVLNTQS